MVLVDPWKFSKIFEGYLPLLIFLNFLNSKMAKKQKSLISQDQLPRGYKHPWVAKNQNREQILDVENWFLTEFIALSSWILSGFLIYFFPWFSRPGLAPIMKIWTINFFVSHFLTTLDLFFFSWFKCKFEEKVGKENETNVLNMHYEHFYFFFFLGFSKNRKKDEVLICA